MAWSRTGVLGLVVDPDGAVYTATQDGVEKLGADGKLIWQRPAPMRPTSASRAFVYGVETIDGRFGPIPSYTRMSTDGTASTALGSGTDQSGVRTYAAPDDARVEIAFDPRSNTLRFALPDGTAWSLAGGDEGAFFSQVAFAPDGTLVVSGRTVNAWSAQDQSVPAQTAFLFAVDRTGRILWLRTAGDLLWQGLGVSGDGSVFALASFQQDGAWGDLGVSAGQSAVLSLSPAHVPAGARVIAEGKPSALAVAPTRGVAVLTGVTDGCTLARIVSLDPTLANETDRDLTPKDCSTGSVEPLDVAFSKGELVVNVHAFGVVQASGESISSDGASTDLLVAYH